MHSTLEKKIEQYLFTHQTQCSWPKDLKKLSTNCNCITPLYSAIQSFSLFMITPSCTHRKVKNITAGKATNTPWYCQRCIYDHYININSKAKANLGSNEI